MKSFRQWLEFHGAQARDKGVRRTMTMPMFNVTATSMPGQGLKQDDPMYCTLHKCDKKKKADKSKSAKLYGFMKKS